MPLSSCGVMSRLTVVAVVGRFHVGQQHGRRGALQHAAVGGGEDDVVGALLVGVAQGRHVDRIGQRLGAKQQPRGALGDVAVVAAVQEDDVDAGLALAAAGRPDRGDLDPAGGGGGALRRRG